MVIPRAGTKVGSSDPLFLFGLGSDHKLSYNRDNRVIFPSSSYLWKCLPPRCWINLSWRCSCFQGLVCSTIKVTWFEFTAPRGSWVSIYITLFKLWDWIWLYARTSNSAPLVYLLSFWASQSSYEPLDKSWMYIKFETFSLSVFIWTRCRLRRFRQHVFFP